MASAVGYSGCAGDVLDEGAAHSQMLAPCDAPATVSTLEAVHVVAFHMLFVDGVYLADHLADGAGQPVFRHVASPGQGELQTQVYQIATRIAVGPRAAHKLFTLQTAPARAPEWLDDPNGAARSGGFCLHADIDIAAWHRAGGLRSARNAHS
jgi:hypothetical protein